MRSDQFKDNRVEEIKWSVNLALQIHKCKFLHNKGTCLLIHSAHDGEQEATLFEVLLPLLILSRVQFNGWPISP